MAIPGQPSYDRMVRLRPRTDTMLVSNGRTLLATGQDGFLIDHSGQGLFVHETRLLSRYRYTIGDAVLYPVTLSNLTQRSWFGYYIAGAPGNPTLPAKDDKPLNSVAQQCLELRLSRYAGEGFHEDVDLVNFTQASTDFSLSLEIESDFADQNEVDGQRRQFGHKTTKWMEGASQWELRSDYQASHAYSHQGETGLAR